MGRCAANSAAYYMGNRDDDIRYSASNWKNVHFLASYLDGGQCVVVIDSLISSALFVKQ